MGSPLGAARHTADGMIAGGAARKRGLEPPACRETPNDNEASRDIMSEKLQRLTFVDDDPDIRAITEFALKEIGGYELDVCASGAEAVQRTSAFHPDLIILDVMMPGMDGVETFKRLRSMPDLAHTPIVFMTAKVMQHEMDRYRALGAADIIPKPFDPLTLHTRLEGIWDQVRKAPAS